MARLERLNLDDSGVSGYYSTDTDGSDDATANFFAGFRLSPMEFLTVLSKVRKAPGVNEMRKFTKISAKFAMNANCVKTAKNCGIDLRMHFLQVMRHLCLSVMTQFPSPTSVAPIVAVNLCGPGMDPGYEPGAGYLSRMSSPRQRWLVPCWASRS